MMAISRLFTSCISRALSCLSASWPRGGREQHVGQDEQRADDQARHAGRQPFQLQLVGHHQRERELEDVVVRGAEELRPEERRKAALASAVRTGSGCSCAHGWTSLQVVRKGLCASATQNIESAVTVSMCRVDAARGRMIVESDVGLRHAAAQAGQGRQAQVGGLVAPGPSASHVRRGGCGMRRREAAPASVSSTHWLLCW